MSLEREVFNIGRHFFFLFEPQREATVPLLLLLLKLSIAIKKARQRVNKWFIVILLLSGRWSY